MQLFIDTHGAYLGVENAMFFVRTEKGKAGKHFPARLVRAIFIAAPMALSSSVVQLALEREVPIIFLDRIGHPLGQIWSGRFGSIATIRKHQALFSQDIRSLYWVKELLLAKLLSQRENLLAWEKRYGLDNKQFARELHTAAIVLEKIETKFTEVRPREGDDMETWKGTFRGWEGTASRHYFRALSALLPLPFRFEQRSRRPALDSFNALLNYLYGIMYSQVELSLMKTGLDPALAMLHSDRHNRPTLVFDCIELYRYWLEDLACELVFSGDLHPERDFRQDEELGFLLAYGKGKQRVIEACMQSLDALIEKGGKRRKRLTHIDMDSQTFASLLKDMDFSKKL